MLDKFLFWVVLVWMVALLIMAGAAVREIWTEDNRSADQPDEAPPPERDEPDKTRPGGSDAVASPATDKAEGAQ